MIRPTVKFRTGGFRRDWKHAGFVVRSHGYEKLTWRLHLRLWRITATFTWDPRR